MKPTTDYHTHPLAHDENRSYTHELLRQWADSGIEHGLNELTFTDHDRFHRGVDFGVFEDVKNEYRDSISLRLGVELDNDPETSVEGRKWTEAHYNQLDYILGSIHFIQDWAYDNGHFKERFKEWDIDELWKIYFSEIRRIAAEGIYDGLAHLDLIKIFSYFPEKDLTPVFAETLDEIKKHDLIIEINTAGWHKPVGEQYPSTQILKMAVQRSIPITVSSDAHAKDHLARDYDKVAIMLHDLGVTEVATFENHKRRMVPLNEN